MALAAEKQGEYEQLHFALMTVSGKLTEDMAYKIAEKIGLDMDQLRRDMEDSGDRRHAAAELSSLPRPFKSMARPPL